MSASSSFSFKFCRSRADCGVNRKNRRCGMRSGQFSQLLAERLDVALQPLSQGGLAFQNIQTAKGRIREGKWKWRVALQQAAAGNHFLSQLFGAENRSAKCAECLAQGDCLDDSFRMNSKQLTCSASMLAESSGAMRVVDEKAGILGQNA